MPDDIKPITSNRKAFHEFEILDRIETGIVLQGTEVKSLREGKANLQEAFCTVKPDGEVLLLGCHISPYSHGNIMNHDPVRPRRLLLHRREIVKLAKAIQQKGFTIIPLKLYFKNGFAKVEIGVARGKKLYDKRADIAERESKRSLDRVNRAAQR